jgi:hypothetical protein
LEGGGHLSGNAPICPAVLQHFDRLIGIHKVSPFRLGKALFDLGSEIRTIGKHPILIPKLFTNKVKGLVEHFFRAHAGPGSPIKHFLLFGFDFEDHGALQGTESSYGQDYTGYHG